MSVRSTDKCKPITGEEGRPEQGAEDHLFSAAEGAGHWSPEEELSTYVGLDLKPNSLFKTPGEKPARPMTAPTIPGIVGRHGSSWFLSRCLEKGVMRVQIQTNIRT
jgi:hypothetical protein